MFVECLEKVKLGVFLDLNANVVKLLESVRYMQGSSADAVRS